MRAAITQNMPTIEDMLRFEDEERERYLSTYFPLEEVCHYFPRITAEKHALLLKDTGSGIQQGVQDYLQKNLPGTKTIYHADIRVFLEDDSVEMRLREKLRDKYPSRYFTDFCREAGGGYQAFLYNYSREIFLQKFTLETTHAYG